MWGGWRWTFCSGEWRKESLPHFLPFYCFPYCVSSLGLLDSRACLNSAIVTRWSLIVSIPAVWGHCESFLLTEKRGMSQWVILPLALYLHIFCRGFYICSIPSFCACRLTPCSRKQQHLLMNAAQLASSSPAYVHRVVTVSSFLTPTLCLSHLRKPSSCPTAILWRWQIWSVSAGNH